MIFKLQALSQHAPRLVLSGSASVDDKFLGRVVAEGQVICETEGLTQSFSVWFASYYVLNCSYPAEYKRSLGFIQKAILNIALHKQKGLMITSVMKKILA